MKKSAVVFTLLIGCSNSTLSTPVHPTRSLASLIATNSVETELSPAQLRYKERLAQLHNNGVTSDGIRRLRASGQCDGLTIEEMKELEELP